MKFISVRVPDSHEWYKIEDWCQENCTSNWYSGSDWSNWIVGEKNRMVQFESELDAVSFALKWS